MFIALLTLWTGVAGYFVVDIWRSMKRQQATAAWVATEGTLLFKEVQPGSGIAKVTARYSYRVDGQEFESRGVAASFDAQRRAVRGIDEGDSVTVYYDPNDPSQTSLIQGSSDQYELFSWLFIGAFAGMTGLGWLAAGGGIARAIRRRGGR